MVGEEMNTFGEMLHRYNWLDDAARGHALKRLGSMKAYISHPDWLLNQYDWLQSVAPTNESLFQMAVNKILFKTSFNWILNHETLPVEDFYGYFFIN